MSAIGTVLESLTTPIESWDPPRESPGRPLTYVDLSSIDRDGKEITNPQRMLGSEAPSRARQLLQSGDVLVSTVRPNLNAVAQVPAELDGATGSTGFCVLRADARRLDGRYLLHWVRSPGFIAEMTRRATGASYPAVSDKIVKGSKIPLPSLPEQRRIAAILDKADAVRRKRQQTIDLADQFLRSAFLDMFGDPVTNPKGWPVSKLDDLIDSARGISYGIVQRGADVEGGISIVRISNIAQNRFALVPVVRTDPAVAEKYKRTFLNGGELLVSIRGTVGRVAIAPPEAKGWNVSREVAVVPVQANISLNYLHHAMLTDEAQRFMLGEVKGIAQRGINLQDLRLLPIPAPPRVEQDRWDRLLTATSHGCQAARGHSDELAALSGVLGTQAFRGELTALDGGGLWKP